MTVYRPNPPGAPAKARQVPNTLGVPCVADELRVARCADTLAECVAAADRRGQPVTIIGGGSNIVPRARLPGLTVLLRLRGLDFERRERDAWRVTAAAGVAWNELVRATLGRGIRGLENLVLIPGCVGAAPMQNIGAYGRELAEVLDTVTVFDRRRGALRTLAAAECGFGYRDSRFRRHPGRFVILRVSMRLGTLPPATGHADVRSELAGMGCATSDPAPIAIAEAVVRARRRKLPAPRQHGNVGSFFKNPVLTARQLDALRGHLAIDAFPVRPVNGQDAALPAYKVPAARLLDAAGWKGVRRGAMQVWPRQPLVLVNHGGARGDDALALAAEIRADLHARYDVALELEPRIVGVGAAQA